MGAVAVELSRDVALELRRRRDAGDDRLTKAAVKAAARGAAGARAGVTRARVVEADFDADPPRLVVELEPGGVRLVVPAAEPPERVLRVAVPAAEHEIYDGATPGWTVVSGRVTGLPGGARLSVSATLRTGEERVATVRLRPAGDGRVGVP